MPKKAITIAIVGPHYAGKSTLSQLFKKRLGFRILKEKWWLDPFLDTRPRDYFKSQIWYLLQTTRSMVKANELNKKGKNVVLDTFIYSTLTFAQTKLSNKEFALYKSLVDNLAPLLPHPKVVVYLYAKPSFLHSVRRMQRVVKNTGPKEDIETPYNWLKKISDLNKKYFNSWKKTPLIKINVEKVDLKNDENAFYSLAKQAIN
jgi:deoxyadenosine/deoxycytidine kinase